METQGHRQHAGKASASTRFIAVDVEVDCGVESVSVPELRITSDVVERALADAETLIRSSGAPNGLDRVHTAFDGYLNPISADAGFSRMPSTAGGQGHPARRREFGGR